MGILKNRLIDIEIISLSNKGNGIGTSTREDGTTFKVEVPFTMPGDKVRVQISRKGRGAYASKLEEMLHPSPDRIMPKCIHFGICGGCRFQHIAYEDQLKVKETLVRKCFESLLNSDIEYRPIIACPSPWHYRNKMEYSFSSDASGKKYLGLIMDSSRGKVFNLTECHLTNGWFVDGLKAIRNWWHESGIDAYHMSRDTGSLRTLTLREGQRTGDRMAVLTVSGNPDFALSKKHLESFVAFLRDAIEPMNLDSKLSIFLRIHQAIKGSPTSFYEMHLYGPDHIEEILNIQIDTEKNPVPITFGISPSAFFQPNPQQAEQIYSTALRMAKIPQDAVVYDLYCGTGALGICISKNVKQVIGIELSRESALDARTNAQRNGCDNVTIFSGEVHEVLSQIAEKKLPPPDIVIVDPPRVGLDPKTIKNLLDLKPAKILYISCNPITQALNIAELVQQGYQLMEIQPVDQFPQTYHVENITVLKRC